MPKYALKLAQEKYVIWSTVVDAPITRILSKNEVKDFLLNELRMSPSQVESRMSHVEKTGTSCRVGGSLKSLLSNNRAGPNETCATLEEILVGAERGIYLRHLNK